jgi:hypothetical protein
MNFSPPLQWHGLPIKSALNVFPKKHEQIPGQKGRNFAARHTAKRGWRTQEHHCKNTLKPRKKKRKVWIQHSSLPKGGGAAAAGSTAAAPFALAAGAGCSAGWAADGPSGEGGEAPVGVALPLATNGRHSRSSKTTKTEEQRSGNGGGIDFITPPRLRLPLPDSLSSRLPRRSHLSSAAEAERQGRYNNERHTKVCAFLTRYHASQGIQRKNADTAARLRSRLLGAFAQSPLCTTSCVHSSSLWFLEPPVGLSRRFLFGQRNPFLSCRVSERDGARRESDGDKTRGREEEW